MNYLDSGIVPYRLNLKSLERYMTPTYTLDPAFRPEPAANYGEGLYGEVTYG